MSGFPKSFKTIEIQQQCRFGFTKDFVSSLVSEWSVIKDYAFIVHDKDISSDGSPAEPHIHLMLRFNSAVPTDAILSKLISVCRIEHLSRMKSWKSAIAYLTHSTVDAKRQGKYLYDDNDVISNFDWKSDRADYLSNYVDLKTLVERVANGEIREYNYTSEIPAYVYAKNKNLFSNAWKFRTDELERKHRALLSDSKGVDSVNILWLYGDAGQGKTSFAKYTCQNKSLDYYITSSGKDPFGEYKGQPAIILDDVRPENFDPSSLLKLIDPDTRSSVQSRYRNKWLEVEWMIITCPFSPEVWWSSYSSSHSNSGCVEQLTRRLNMGAWNISRSGVDIRLYSDEGSILGDTHMKLPEDFILSFGDKPITFDGKIAQIQASFPGLSIDGNFSFSSDNSISFKGSIDNSSSDWTQGSFSDFTDIEDL